MGMHAGDSGAVMSGMKKVTRSNGARLTASLDTGTVLRDLLQTVAPATPDSTGLSQRHWFSRPWLHSPVLEHQPVQLDELQCQGGCIYALLRSRTCEMHGPMGGGLTFTL